MPRDYGESFSTAELLSGNTEKRFVEGFSLVKRRETMTIKIILIFLDKITLKHFKMLKELILVYLLPLEDLFVFTRVCVCVFVHMCVCLYTCMWACEYRFTWKPNKEHQIPWNCS